MGRDLERVEIEGVETIEFTPKSVGTEYKSYEDWFRVKPEEQTDRWVKGVIELKTYLERIYEKPFFTIQLHDDPIDMVNTQFILFYPAYNVRLDGVLDDYIERIKGLGYCGYAEPSYPFKRPFHSTNIEYFPAVRRGITVREGSVIAEELVKHLKEKYLPLFKKRS